MDSTLDTCLQRAAAAALVALAIALIAVGFRLYAPAHPTLPNSAAMSR
jgi:hypothetical protein